MYISFTHMEYFKYAVILFMFMGICDMLDGPIARKCKRTDEEKAFGVQIDSLVDVFSFVAYPIVLLYALGLDKWYNVIIFAIFAICGIARLAHFNIKSADKSKSVKFYEGLPVTSVACIYPLAFLLMLCIPRNIFLIIYSILTLLIALLFVLRIKIPNQKE